MGVFAGVGSTDRVRTIQRRDFYVRCHGLGPDAVRGDSASLRRRCNASSNRGSSRRRAVLAGKNSNGSRRTLEVTGKVAHVGKIIDQVLNMSMAPRTTDKEQNIPRKRIVMEESNTA